MILETAVGGLLGGALRLAPEVLKWLDRKNERAHELAMQRQATEAAAAQAEHALRLAEQQRGAAYDVASLQALQAAIAAQAQPSGVRWVDALSAGVRPAVTFAYFGLYAAARVATFVLAIAAGTPALEVLAAVWTAEDQLVLSAILNFWFLGRVFDKADRR